MKITLRLRKRERERERERDDQSIVHIYIRSQIHLIKEAYVEIDQKKLQRNGHE